MNDSSSAEAAAIDNAIDDQVHSPLVSITEMNSQQQGEHSSTCQTGWTGISGEEACSDSRGSPSAPSSSFDDAIADHVDGNRFDTISCCGSVVEVRFGMYRSSSNRNNDDDQTDADQGRYRGVSLLAGGQSINGNIFTSDNETNKQNSERRRRTSRQQSSAPPLPEASSSQSSPIKRDVIEDIEHSHCCICPGDRVDSGCNPTKGQSEAVWIKKTRDCRCRRSRALADDCIETAPHLASDLPRAQTQPALPLLSFNDQEQQLCPASHHQAAHKDATESVLEFDGYGTNQKQFSILASTSKQKQWATTVLHESSSKATIARNTDVSCWTTSVEHTGEIVQAGNQKKKVEEAGGSQRTAVAISDCDGQSKSSVVVFDNQTSKCELGSSIHGGDPQGCSPLRGLLLRIKLIATNLVVSIRDRQEEEKGEHVSCEDQSKPHSLSQQNPCNPTVDLRGNLTTAETITKIQRQQLEGQTSVNCGAPTNSFDDNDNLATDTRANQSCPLTAVFVESDSAANITDVRRGGEQLLGVNDTTRGGVLGNGGKLEVGLEPKQLSQAKENDCKQDTVKTYNAQTIVHSALSISSEQSQVVVMTNMASGNEVSAKSNEQQQHRLLHRTKKASNVSLFGNMNSRQQLEQEQTEICNRTPSQQQIKQKHFNSTISDDRRSTHCSSSGAMTATELNCDSSISSGGLNYCSDSVSHPHPHLHLHLHQQHQHQHQNRQHQNLQQQTATLTTNRRGEEIMEANERCAAIRGQSRCPSGSSSSVSIEQQRVIPASKLGDQCRITLSPNNQKQMAPLNHFHDKPLRERDIWDKNIEFLLAVIGFAVDLGNIWRFPYICYKNGGGAFLIPYTIMFILGGLPIFYLEMSLGQYFSSGCLTVWRRVCPMAKGIGYAMCVLNFFTGLYYNTIISWAVFFFVESFTFNSLPWTSCNNSWNSGGCKTIEQRQEMRRTEVNMSDQFSSPTRDYFEREVLHIHLSKGIDDLGSIRTPLAVYLAIVFVCIYFAIWKGVKSTGKAVWITALLPYFVLIPLLVRGVLLEGSSLGIKYYLYPDWYKILDVNVWIDAAKQIYFSLGPGFGTLMALSSYNRFNHNCRRDALIAAAVNYFASFIAGLVIFAVLGYMATIGRISIDKVATEGPGLVFQVYPEGLATMRFSAMWSVLFFMMVITLGIDSTFGGLESVITGLCDEYPRILRNHRGIFIGLLIIVIYVCSLPTTTYGGNYVIGLLESYGTSVSLLFIVTIETIIVCWLYGTDRFCNNLKEMYGEMPGAYWRICWKYISPTILILIFIAACLQELDKYHTLKIDDYTFPGWAPTIGLLMTGSSVCCVPIYAIYYLKTKTSGSFYERLKSGSTPKEQDETDEKDHNDTHLDTDI